MLPLAAQVSDHYLCTRGELSSSGCAFHPGERQTRTGLRCRTSTHDEVEANLPLCGRSAVVSKVGIVTCHDRLPAASPGLASVRVGRRSAAPSGDVSLPEAAACWASQ